MILKDFYLDKKARIEAETCFSGTIPNITLYTDSVFRKPLSDTTVLFKYDSINWEAASGRSHTAAITFCIYIVLPLQEESKGGRNYEAIFDIAKSIDKAILSSNINMTHLVNSNSICKVQEKQYCNQEQNNQEKTDYFIWEISYNTELTEAVQKKSIS